MSSTPGLRKQRDQFGPEVRCLHGLGRPEAEGQIGPSDLGRVWGRAVFPNWKLCGLVGECEPGAEAAFPNRKLCGLVVGRGQEKLPANKRGFVVTRAG